MSHHSWVLGIILWSSGNTPCALNCRSNSADVPIFSKKKKKSKNLSWNEIKYPESLTKKIASSLVKFQQSSSSHYNISWPITSKLSDTENAVMPLLVPIAQENGDFRLVRILGGIKCLLPCLGDLNLVYETHLSPGENRLTLVLWLQTNSKVNFFNEFLKMVDYIYSLGLKCHFKLIPDLITYLYTWKEEV